MQARVSAHVSLHLVTVVAASTHVMTNKICVEGGRGGGPVKRFSIAPEVNDNWPSFLNCTKRLKAHNCADWLHHPCLLAVPMVGRNQSRKRVDVVEMSKKCVPKGRNG